MKVTETKPQTDMMQQISQGQKPNAPEKAQKPREMQPQYGEDQVNLSSEAKEMKHIHDIVEKTPEVRMEKVELLQKQVEEGRYKADAEATAGKMMQEAIFELNK